MSSKNKNKKPRYLCAIMMIEKLFAITISRDEMNAAIKYFRICNKFIDKERHLKHPQKPLPTYGTITEGKLSEHVVIYLIQKYCKCDCVKVKLSTGKQNMGRIVDFMSVYHREHGGDGDGASLPIWVSGWTINTSDMVGHSIGIKDGFIWNGDQPPLEVTADNLASSLFGLDNTRLRAYILKPQKMSERKKRKMESLETTTSLV